MYADEKAETMSREEISALQLERLKRTVSHAAEKSSFYRNEFEKAGFKPGDIQTLADVKKIPFLTFEMFHRADPFDLLTLPLSGIVRVHHIDESEGEITKFYTREDVRKNVEMTSGALVAAGIHRASVVGLQGDLSDNKFLDVLYSLESIGATVIPLGTDYRRWLKCLELFKPDIIVTTPQLIMQLIIQIQAIGEDIADYPVKKIVCINLNNIQNPLQQHIEMRAETEVFNLFSPAEIGTPGMIYQCETNAAHHVREDNFLIELVKFSGDEVIEEDDCMGELVITTLSAQAMPLIRYRTGQAVRRTSERCPCGRTFVRIATPYTKPEEE